MPISVCVFCGSKVGASDDYATAARELGVLLAARGMRLVFGGGHIGLMGVVADAVLAGGGPVTGVIPNFLADRELAHPGVADMRLVSSMHERKALMAEECDLFMALPGGLGTFEELLEVITWKQLAIHAKPVGVLNVQGFFDPLLLQLEHAVQEEFLSDANRRMLIVEKTPAALLDRLVRALPVDGTGGEVSSEKT